MSLPRYPKYRDSGVEWLGEVPEHWIVRRLRFVAEINPSKSEIRDLDNTTTVSFLPMEAIGDDGSLNLERERSIADVETGYTYFRNGDVTVAKITPCFENGKGALMRGLANGIGFGTTELIVARPRPGLVTGRFLHLLFTSEAFRRLGESHMYGAGGQKRVPDEFVRDFATALPLVSEQALIVSFLDRETAKIDALVAEQQRLIDLLKEKRQAVISHAVTKGLNPDAPMKPSGVEWLGCVPAHWSIAPVTARYQIQLGKMLDSSRITGKHLRPYLRVFDVQWGQINTQDLPLMDFDEDDRQKFALRAGDLVVNEGGSYVGRSAIWTGDIEECYYQKALHRLRPRDPASDVSEYFYYVMFFAATFGVFMAGNNQNTIDHLPAEKLRRYRFAYPPVPEQAAIVEYLDRQAAEYDALVEAARGAIALLQERRTALIAAAVTGQIDVRGLMGAEAA